MELVEPIPKGGDIPKAFATPRKGFDYAKREAMVPRRDGVKLHVVIAVSKGAPHAPIKLDRTPYNADKLTRRG